jgi:hypothetical protein
MSTAYDEGYETYVRWLSSKEDSSMINPYDKETTEYIEWEKGWEDADGDYILSLSNIGKK